MSKAVKGASQDDKSMSTPLLSGQASFENTNVTNSANAAEGNNTLTTDGDIENPVRTQSKSTLNKSATSNSAEIDAAFAFN